MIKKRTNNNIEHEVFETLKKCQKETKDLITSIEKILSKGIDINYQDEKTGTTFLMLTIENNLSTLFDLIMSYQPLIEMKNNNGETAMHIAARSENPEYLDSLIECGAHLNVIDCNGNTPINNAIKACFKANIQNLMDNGAALNFLNYCGLSIYDIAFMTEDLEIIDFVINYEKKDEEKKKKNFVRKLFKK